MTSKADAQETSEFLRRRQLRLQQVREQSKDIAKKIRQRAKVEKLRQVVELDEKKERDYKQSQDKVVKKLEELYSRGLNKVGSSHKQAGGLSEPVNVVEKADLSHLRGREAAAELKRQKQQKFDELKKSLDRKLLAREAANELSREKSAWANKLSKLPSKINTVNEETKSSSENVNGDVKCDNKDLSEEVSRTDMATQWDADLLPPEWEPNVPALTLPQEDEAKEAAGERDNVTGRQRKTDLFALSDEMPSSLRGGTSKPCDTGPSKISSTLVSEYIQNRVLRLREPEMNTSKQHSDDLKNLRQTITRSRPLRPKGSAFSNICHVVEGQGYPVPMWHPETSCQCQSPRKLLNDRTLERKHFTNVTHSNKLSCLAPVKQNSVSNKSPVSRRARPLIPHKCWGCNQLADNTLLRSKESDSVITKKKSVTTYNHHTKDTRDVPRLAERIVHRDRSLDRDAYTQAASESVSACDHDHQKKTQQSANKIAVTRQNVEKEYKDTIAFLNSLPKNKNSRTVNNAFKDDHRLQAQRDYRQRILQQEFRNIEVESRIQSSQGCKSKSRLRNMSPHTQTKPSANFDNSLNERDLQYSWMPVPESDSKLAVHTIPTGGRAGRAPHAHSVKFNVDSYHEYRSRHKHTPPTKDTAGGRTAPDRKPAQTVLLQKDGDTSSDESVASEETSTDADGRESDPKQDLHNVDSPKRKELTETERIIIYKILNHKHRKKNKFGEVNSTGDVTPGNEETKSNQEQKILQSSSNEAVSKDVQHEHVRADENALGHDHPTEGVYAVAGKNKLSCNILNCDDSNLDPWKSMSQRNIWWDNVESMYFSGLDKSQSSSSDNKLDKQKQGPCSRNRTDAGDSLLQSRKKCSSAKCKGHSAKIIYQHDQNTAKSSPTVAATVTAAAQEADFVKLIEDGQRQGNFFIGATGFLKTDAYEVIIQLRKNDTAVVKTQDAPVELKTADIETENTQNSKSEAAPSLEHKEDVQPKELIDNSNPPVANDPHLSAIDDVINSEANLIEDDRKQLLSNAQPMKTTRDISMSTSLSEQIPESIAKSEHIARPATSTCTQTTPSPTNKRPVYIHMSSSTSTAYMSPPEVVLPHSFKRGDKPCRARHSSRKNQLQEESKFIRREHHCRSYSSCQIIEKMLTKPNIDRLNFYADIYKEKKEFTPSSCMEKKICPKRNKRGASEQCCKHQTRKMRHHLNAAKQNMRKSKSGVVHSKMNKTIKHASHLSSKSYLSPMIQQYIHKLLSLNREDIKAIQVMTEDCSSVNTPASSIINMPTNFSSNNRHGQHLGLGRSDWKHFESVLKHHVFLNKNESPDNTTISKNKKVKNIKPRIINSKNKRVHKVKSLNISKRMVVNTDVSNKTKINNCLNKVLSNHASSERDSDDTKNQWKSSDKNNVVFQKRPINQYDKDAFCLGQTKTASSNCNSNNATDVPSNPINISTQTSCTVGGEVNFIKLAEDKLQNMEKIADLTEKCTKRLSNLAKVLEEVRKNKSLAYSQASTADSASDSDQKSDKGSGINDREDIVKTSKNPYNIYRTDYESLISGVQNSCNNEIPQIPNSDNDLCDNSITDCISQTVSSTSTNDDGREKNNGKCRNRPPPALLRMNLKHPQDKIVPHELSTVMEVDSPMSVKFKQQSPINTNQSVSSNIAELKKDDNGIVGNKSSNEKSKVLFSDSSEDLKLQMMDLNKFNEIMLKPFVSLQEYARDHYDRSAHTQGGNVSRDGMTDDISSLNSEASLPDVVAELLKRKLITEPFRFDTASNMNSTTISSESTLSLLALSKGKKDKAKSKLTANKENVAETSDSLSISSNPDLENAFKKLGMGWASSTLKKTKERLALSSSSNTSSSSLSQIKFKNSVTQDEAVAEAIWSVSNISKKPALKRRLDTSKNVEQQTSFTQNMTVKEYLTKVLAKKITFTDRPDRNDTNQEFVSLYETKLPDDLKNSSQNMVNDNSGDISPNGNNNRARTSTPVKIFKSMTYHSSSSSNLSNGLFSNADELSSVKLTSGSVQHQSASEKDELTIPNCSLKMRKTLSDCSKTDSG